jgi:hypothetical protein
MAIKKSKKSVGKKHEEKAEEAEKAGERKNAEEKTKISTEEITNNNLKSLRWVIGIGIVVVVIVFFAIWYSEASKKFDYAGLSFRKEMFGKIPICTTQLSGYNTNGQQINFKLALRNDPRTLKNIPVNGTIRFVNNKDVYVSFNLTSEMSECDNSSISLVGYGYFMASMGFKVKSTATSSDIAKKYNMTVANCNTHPQNTVVLITPSNETKIEQSLENKNCYILSFKNCEILQVMERFEVATLTNLIG